MSWIDIGIIIVVIIGAINGYRHGFLMELFSLLAIVLGILGAFKLLGIALVYLHDQFDVDEKYLPYIAFGIVFILIVVVVLLIGRALKASINKSFLGRMDEVAGSLLAVFKTVFMVSVLLWIASSFDSGMVDTWAGKSWILPHIAGVAPEITSWIAELIPAFGDIFKGILS